MAHRIFSNILGLETMYPGIVPQIIVWNGPIKTRLSADHTAGPTSALLPLGRGSSYPSPHSCSALPAFSWHSTRCRSHVCGRWFQLAQPTPWASRGDSESKYLPLWASMLGGQRDRFLSCPSGSLGPWVVCSSLFCWAKSTRASGCHLPPTCAVTFSLTPLVLVLFLFWTSTLLIARTSCENIFKSWLYIIRPQPHCANSRL